jgi:cold shock CspA family protein
MNIDFGVVKKYFSDRGFGFVERTFRSSHQSEVFFHIKSIRKLRTDLAEKLDDGASLDTIYFWYETENTSKGEQVYKVLPSDAVSSMVLGCFSSFVEKIESIWGDVDSTLPVWIHDVTFDLVGGDRAKELIIGRQEIERERRDLEEERRKEKEAQEKVEEKEFQKLLAEMKPLGFTESREVSAYIMDKRLGCKYRNISGVVRMEQDGTSWNFSGGFPPTIYARLCEELGLISQGTRARAVGFKPFKDL